jgi:hypothetical protein
MLAYSLNLLGLACKSDQNQYRATGSFTVPGTFRIANSQMQGMRFTRIVLDWRPNLRSAPVPSTRQRHNSPGMRRKRDPHFYGRPPSLSTTHANSTVSLG